MIEVPTFEEVLENAQVESERINGERLDPIYLRGMCREIVKLYEELASLESELLGGR